MGVGTGNLGNKHMTGNITLNELVKAFAEYGTIIKPPDMPQYPQTMLNISFILLSVMGLAMIGLGVYRYIKHRKGQNGS